MNKQRKVLFTITYNEMGIIIDTKAEEVTQPNLQPTCNQLASDTISRLVAIDEEIRCAICKNKTKTDMGCDGNCQIDENLHKEIIRIIEKHLSPAQPEERTEKRTDKRTKTHVCDLISRQATINAIHNLYAIHGSEGSWIDQRDAFNAVNNLPSAQPEQKKGKWIQNDNGTYSCSLCHSWIPEEQYYYAQFCLYCGADMRGGESG